MSNPNESKREQSRVEHEDDLTLSEAEIVRIARYGTPAEQQQLFALQSPTFSNVRVIPGERIDSKVKA